MKTLRNKNLQVIFLLTTLGICLIYGPFIFGERLYVYMDIGADTYSSYWPYYVFFSEFVKGMNFGFWSFNFGLGGNILTTHNLLFDPFNFILFLFNKEIIDYGIVVVSILKIYFVSYFGYKFLRLFKFSDYSLVIATLSYTFSGYFIVWGQHYHYATMFVLFTMLMYYIEYWIRLKEFKILVLIIAIMAINSPYFLYMICLFLGIYILFRFCYEHKFSLKLLVVFSLKTIGIFLLGFMLGAIILIPEVYTMLNSPRIGANIIPKIQFASTTEYISIISSFLSNNLLGTHYFNGYGNYYESPHLFIGTILLLIFPKLFSKNIRNGYILIVGAILLIIIFVPAFSNPIFNGFSAYTYRWTFCLMPIFSLALARSLTILEKEKINDEFSFNSIIIMYVSLMCVIFTAYVYRDQILILKENINIIKYSFILLIIMLTSFLLIICMKWDRPSRIRTSKLLLVLIVIIELFVNSYISVVERSTITSDSKNDLPYFDNTNKALEFIKSQDSSFYRVFKTYSKIDLNDALFQDYYGDKLYNSLNNQYLIDFGRAFDVRAKDSLHYIVGYDDKIDLYNLLGFKYMLTKQKSDYFGFEYLDNFGDVYVYKNNHALPLSFVYENAIDNKKFESLSINQKLINIFSHAIVLSNESDFSDISNNVSQKRVFLKPNIYTEGITISQNTFPEKLKFMSNSLDSFIILPLEKDSDKPLKINFTTTSENISNGKIYYKTLESNFNEENAIPFQLANGRKEYSFEINMLNISEIKLQLSDNVGEYGLEDFSVTEKDVDFLNKQQRHLKDNQLNINYFSENKIKGKINREREGILFFSIPFDEGWKAKVNGKSVPIERINYGFVGINITAGTNEIELYYEQNYILTGFIITLSGCIIYLVLLIRRKKQTDNKTKHRKNF